MKHKLLQINVSANNGSTGKITEGIANTAIAFGYESYIAYGGRTAAGKTISDGDGLYEYGRTNNDSHSQLIRIGNKMDTLIHGLLSRLFDIHGLASIQATKKFVRQIKKIQPDIIHLHNIHGYYINYRALFNYLNRSKIPIIWTLHDCWPLTGHCTFFVAVNCKKWQTWCCACPNKKGYPKSLFLDNSENNYGMKKKMFSSCKNLTIVTPSVWLANIVEWSYLRNKNIITIHNGIDTELFKPTPADDVLQKYAIPKDKFIILGVANIWDKRKGFEDFLQLSKCMDNSNVIVLAGLNKKQQKNLPKNITGISRTENANELAQLYSASGVFVNPTRVDNFPTTNLEALACGTPVITYNTGGSPEAISDDTGFTIEKGDIPGLIQAIDRVKTSGKAYFSEKCRQRAIELYNMKNRYHEYIELYNSLINN